VDAPQFVMRPEAGAPVDQPLAQAGFTFGGGPVGPDDPRCLAKRTANAATGEERFYVRSCTRGYQAGEMFNPATHAVAELHQENPALGRPQFEFRRVEKPAFAHYLSFLKTGNPASLRAAERVR
jgi:hypothetical protein